MQPPQPGFDPTTCVSVAEYLSHYTTAAGLNGRAAPTICRVPGSLPSLRELFVSGALLLESERKFHFVKVPVPAQRPHKLSPTAECHFTFKQRDGWRRSNGAPATVIRQRRGRRSAAGAGLG
ncbi:hypothetical protein HPB51_003088 [Rhipicephalus microplus]|uniref:Uncharacterized protein n=1 Tax=Rhipicephalus microplus TaxID=6941 RepID=A0A9J6EEH0_RHIMP|nr:hypothetical protein HPB51_003088 [Rhipicephalus microplus]